jgi:peptide/nickel transport system permease protein
MRVTHSSIREFATDDKRMVIASSGQSQPAGVTLSTAPLLVERRTRKSHGVLAWTLLRLLRQSSGRFAIALLGSLIVIALAASAIAPFDPNQVGAGGQFSSPNWSHPFGTDELGRDVLSRIMFGTRISLSVALLSALGALALALPVGLIAGYRRGFVDTVICRIFDTIFSFPAILLGIGLVAIRGAQLSNVILAISIIYVPTLGRLTRVAVLTQRAEEYVEAAKSVGSPGSRILARHILPNVLPPLLVQLTLVMADAVLLEAAFSFLGLGIPPPAPSWGVMLDGSRNYLKQAPWLGIFAGAAITFLVLALNALGDALRIAMDPRRP